MAVIPPIDPKIIEASDQMVRAQQRQARRQWVFDNMFKLINSFIAVVALIVAIFGLYLPKG